MLDQNGKSVKLSDYFGKPIVLNFWASWCPPCKSEMPHFNKLYLEMNSKYQFIMVDLVDGQRETLDIGKAYIKEKGFEFPVFYDTQQKGAYAYQLSSIPVTILIDKDGNIVYEKIGAMSEQALRTALEKLD